MRSWKPSSSCSQMSGYPHTIPHFSLAVTWGINFKRWQNCLFKDKFRGPESTQPTILHSSSVGGTIFSQLFRLSPWNLLQMEATPSSRLVLSGRNFCDDGNILRIVQYGCHTRLLDLLKCHTLRPSPPHTLVFCHNVLIAPTTL